MGIDRTYTPPISDPAHTATVDWDKLRQQLMLTRDALTDAETTIITQRKQIEQQEKELVTLRKQREEDRNEAISLRTSLVNAADIILTAAKRSNIDRRGGDEFAPRAVTSQVQGDPVTQGDQKELEDILSRVGQNALSNIAERQH